MKRLLTILCVLLFFTAMLIFPKETFQGASSGVLLWFHTVLPTLLPFLIISNLLIHTGAINLISRLLAPILCRFFRVSPYGAFVILIGFLCGCPMGSKVTADLLKKEAICEKEARYLLSFCNNTSPMFIVSYILWQNLNVPELTLPLLTLLTAAPVLLSFVFRCLYHIPVQGVYITSQDTLSVNGRDSLDTCIMNGFETITRIGGYIILFSILISFAELIIAKSACRYRPPFAYSGDYHWNHHDLQLPSVPKQPNHPGPGPYVIWGMVRGCSDSCNDNGYLPSLGPLHSRKTDYRIGNQPPSMVLPVIQIKYRYYIKSSSFTVNSGSGSELPYSASSVAAD